MEICCYNLQSCLNAEANGASRIELCSDGGIGGITPPIDLVRVVLDSVKIPVQVIIRPRDGNFIYSAEEIDLIRQQIMNLNGLEISGIVFGALTVDNNIDKLLLKNVVAWSKPRKVTFHKAFDETGNPFAALEEIIDAGCERILTSGCANNVVEGLDVLKQLVGNADGRISIMPGGGLRSGNLRKIMTTGANEYHSSALLDGKFANAIEIANMAALLS